MNRIIFILLLCLAFGIGLSIPFRAFWVRDTISFVSPTVLSPSRAPSPTPTPTPIPLPSRKVLENSYHIFQSFNNCGPASLSMALSYYGIQESQAVLGQALRPYQVPGGDNDDKSVTLGELAEKSKDYNLIPFHRPGGTVSIVKQLIANDIPVLTRTWLTVDEDIGHYRVIKGYDDEQQVFIQDDSLQGANLSITYSDFMEMWQKFNYEYLALIPNEKVHVAPTILQTAYDENSAWADAVTRAQSDVSDNPNDIYARFNLSVALYHVGDFKRAISEFEQVEQRLPQRTLWYQIEPINAYVAVGNDEKVLEITSKILNNENRAFSELYVIRGNIYKKRGELNAAKTEYEKAVLYNRSLEAAQNALQSVL